MPVDDPLEVRQLDALAGQLANASRHADLFDPGKPLIVGADGHAAWARTVDDESGLRADEGGGRSAWCPVAPSATDEKGRRGVVLPGNSRADLASLPAPVRYAATVGMASSSPPGRARILADPSLPYEHIASQPDEVAAALAARLVSAFRRDPG